MKGSRKGGTEKSLGAQIIDGLKEAIAYEHGELRTPVTRRALSARQAHVAPAPSFKKTRIVKLRERLNVSQPVFAQALNVSPETVKKWEQGFREPDGAALRLLEFAEDHPAWLLEKINSSLIVTKKHSKSLRPR